MITAFVRSPTHALLRCRLTFLPREPIDPDRAREQHGAYVRALEEALGRDPERAALEGAVLGGAGEANAGLSRLPPRVVRLPERPGLPDSVFVEDTAVAVGPSVVLARPGAPERREEVADVQAALLLAAGGRRVDAIREPGTLDGGDVLVLGRRVFVGLSGRTDEEGARQLAAILDGREVVPVPVSGCLHLKTAASAISSDPDQPAVLVNPRWVDPSAFAPAEVLPVPEEEPFAANVLTLPGPPGGPPTVLLSSRWPATRRLLEERGLRTVPLDLSELEKAEAGPTCLSLLVGG